MATTSGHSSRTVVVTLPNDEQILITRQFAAPKHLVYKAWTTPELVKRWWASDNGEMTVAEIDLRVGGTWRYVMLTNDGYEVAFHGEYREIVPNERIVTTEVFEAPNEHGAQADATENQVPLNTVTFIEEDGFTIVRLLVQCPSKEIRDAIMNSGMEVGVKKSWDYLERVAASLG